VELFQTAPGYLRYQLLRWGLRQSGTVFGLLFGLALLGAGPAWMSAVTDAVVPDEVVFVPRAFGGFAVFRWLELIGLGFWVLQLPVSLAGVLLDVQQRWYLVTDRSLRVREGIFRVEEKTMSLRNIQNLSTEQGPLQRLLGIADLQVRSAGGGESTAKKGKKDGAPALHVAYFRGVDRAEAIKDLILRRQKALATGGATPAQLAAQLPAAADETGADRPDLERELVDAAREMVAEARRVRESLPA
jgi:uncharacterized membrane protein YdbT with pleckstrin-like domain